MFILLVIIAIIIVDLAALKWGIDSTDKIDSSEWEKKRVAAYALNR